ncbi:unnamed protein product [Peronospora belbahrii]|uniref:RxLR effector protein n=1 Tax=Peronospora belbahrii TaxID=622444 RepID=A0ABN8CZS7_9STRA|nr:unnamed protein product [Peronospora belbahrii]
MSALSLPVDQFKVRIPSHMRDHNDEEERAPIKLTLSDNNLTNQLASIFRKGHTTNEVFEWFKLHEVKGSILANPYMNRWMRYMKRFNDKPDSQKTTPLKTVQHYYANGDDTVFPEVIAVGKQDIETKQKAELLEWLHQKRHPKLVFEQLMVNHENTNVLSYDTVIALDRLLGVVQYRPS